MGFRHRGAWPWITLLEGLNGPADPFQGSSQRLSGAAEVETDETLAVEIRAVGQAHTCLLEKAVGAGDLGLLDRFSELGVAAGYLTYCRYHRRGADNLQGSHRRHRESQPYNAAVALRPADNSRDQVRYPPKRISRDELPVRS